MTPTTPAPNSAPRRSKIFKRTVITLLVLANFLVGVVFWRLVTVQSAIANNATRDSNVVGVLDPLTVGDPVTFLLVGSDSREGLDDLSNFGAVGGERSDVMILLRVYPGQGRAAMLSLPRDLWVDIPGNGSSKLNAAYAIGGSTLLVSTIKSNFGVEVNHYVEVDFVGFKAIVDELGGVTIDFPYAARDSKSGLNVQAGSQTLMGDQALAYARSRSYQERQPDGWTSVDANDIGRTRRQQQLILAILSAAKRPANIAEAGSIAASFAQHLTLDSELADSSLIELGFSMRGITSSNIDSATLPTYGDTVGEASVLRRDEPEATAMLGAFLAGNPLNGQASSDALRLQVLNGNGIEGSAGAAASQLEARGFSIVGVGDAEQKTFTTTVVIVRPADVARAQIVIDALGFGRVDAGSVPDGVDGIVVVGGDFIGTTN